MPYELRGNCVHKQGDDQAMKCYDNHEDAVAYLRALEAATQDEKMLMRPSQEEAGYIVISPKLTDGKACGSCRWFEAKGQYCHLIKNYPLDILPTGFCNRWELAPEPPSEMEEEPEEEIEEPEEEMMPMMDMQRHDEPTPGVGYIAPDNNAEGLLKQVGELFKRGLKPGQSVLKGADGARYMLIVTSNSYQDRDNETITTDALKGDVDRHWTDDDTAYMSDNPLLIWHDDRLKIGDIVYGNMHGPFLVELARELTNGAQKALSEAAFDYREAHPDDRWGASHRFAYYPKHRDKSGVFYQIRKRETSILPRDVAANALTFSGVIPMSNKRDEYLNKMLGIENAAELLDKGIDVLVSELAKRGIEHKSIDDPTDEIQEAGDKYGNLLATMLEAQADMDARLEAKETELTEAKKALSAQTVSVDERIKALAEQVDALKAQLDARPRMASRAVETEIEPEKIPDSVKNSLKKRDEFWGTEIEGL